MQAQKAEIRGHNRGVFMLAHMAFHRLKWWHSELMEVRWENASGTTFPTTHPSEKSLWAQRFLTANRGNAVPVAVPANCCYHQLFNARQKQRLFARLLASGLEEGVFTDVDDYEDLLGVIDDLTEREFLLLLALENYERKYYENGRFASNKHRSFEGLFRQEAAQVLQVPIESLPDDELRASVIRLNRTGCYALMGWRDGPAKDCALTNRYYRLKKLITDEEGGFFGPT